MPAPSLARFPLSAHHMSAVSDQPYRPCGAPHVGSSCSGSRAQLSIDWADHVRLELARDTHPGRVRDVGFADAEPILMLPAMSTVARDELRALAHHLETRRCVITDWPGFGDAARPRLDYDRALCRGFLEELVAHLGANSKTLVPGDRLRPCGRLCDRPRSAVPWHLHAPGPDRADLARPSCDHDERAKVHPGTHPNVDPRAGHRRAALSTERLRPVVRMMYRRHVFADPAFLTDKLFADRMRLARPGRASLRPASSPAHSTRSTTGPPSLPQSDAFRLRPS